MKNKNINIVITGDTHLGSERVCENALKCNVDNLLAEFLTVIQNSDLAITNIESPIIDQGEPSVKFGPHLKSPVDSLKVIKEAGFDLVTLANNHIMDYGEEGLISTLDNCKRLGIETVGAGKNFSEASATKYCNLQGTNIAIINLCENEFGTASGNSCGSHPLDPIQNYYTIKETSNEADIVVVIVHGGHEMYPLPSPRMKKTYRYFVDSGADVVVGHHTHCYSGYEVYKNSPIFYSLGNFLFDIGADHNKKGWNEGILLELIFNNKKIDFILHPYVQNREETGVFLLGKEEGKKFWENIKKLNQIIENDDKLNSSFKKYCKNSQRLYKYFIEPHSSRMIHFFQKKNVLPSFLKERKKYYYLIYFDANHIGIF
ncbi:MAG: CapA family protein [Balneolaceae bacterium]|nr:CapA family protein [Balneolaceae bacterium]